MTSSKLLASSVVVVSRVLLIGGLAAPVFGGQDPKMVAIAEAPPLSVPGLIERLDEYVKLRTELEKDLPELAPTDQPAKVEARKRTLAARVRKARVDAKPGGLFGDAGEAIRRVITQDAQARPLEDVKAVMEEVPAQVPVVNADYPEDAPLATVPPLLIRRLPKLADGLEYRFMGRDLIIRDMKCNLILDIVREATPAARK